MDSDEVLRERMVRGERAAFDELYQRHVVPLFAFARRYLGDAHEAEDVVHDAFMAALGSEDPAVRHVRAWLFTIARNLCLNRLRTRKRAAAALDQPMHDEADADPAAELAMLERNRAVSRAVGALPDRLAELYRLRASGLSYRELSDTLGIPVGTVKSRMNEMVKRLRAEVQ